MCEGSSELGSVGYGDSHAVTERSHPARELLAERFFAPEEVGGTTELEPDGVRRAHGDRGAEREGHVRHGGERPLDAVLRHPVDLELRDERARLRDALPFEHAVPPSHVIDGDEPFGRARRGTRRFDELGENDAEGMFGAHPRPCRNELAQELRQENGGYATFRHATSRVWVMRPRRSFATRTPSFPLLGCDSSMR